MMHLTFVAITLALVAGFLTLTAYEARTQTRVLASLRERLDRQAARAFFIIAHVDLAAFLRDTTREIGKRVAHDVVHLTLVIVRMVERLLTRAVRSLRSHGKTEAATTTASASPFVRSMNDLKNKLRNGDDATAPSDE